MKTFNYEQLELRYFDNDIDSNDVVIFIHGNSHSHRTFRYQLEDKRFQHLRILALDLPGHGLSSRSTKYNMALFVGMLEAFVKSLNLTNYVLVGHSLGGHIATQSLTCLNPKGILIFGTPPLRNPPDMSAFRDHPATSYLFKNELSDAELDLLMKSFYNDYQITNADIAEVRQTDSLFREKFAQSVGELKFADEIELLRHYDGHKAVLHATQDKFINKEYIEKNVGPVVEIESSHNMHIENAEDFNQALLSFIQTSFNLPVPSFRTGHNEVIVKQ
ncbi:alpha/beta fold hydrolase [Peredibacter sp. HCB2-198]|uniref:alpha/beta fold hydrolase n=1 Tax=Peredibacter sp. HCB2-198 TaxID=3383025 RepID=UPI0038B4D0A3